MPFISIANLVASFRTRRVAFGAVAALSLLSVTALIPSASVKTGSSHSHLMAADSDSNAASTANVVLAASHAAQMLRPNYAASALNLRHWNQNVLTVHVTPQAGDHRRSEAQTIALVAKSISLWNERIGNTVVLKLAEDDATDADVQVSFVQPKTLAGGAIGRTDVTFRLSDQVLTHANVRLNLGLPNDQLVQVAAHELGHALGIEGHSDDPHDLMYAYAHVPAQITERDLNTMAMSYNKTTFDARPAIASDVDVHTVAATSAITPNSTSGTGNVQ